MQHAHVLPHCPVPPAAQAREDLLERRSASTVYGGHDHVLRQTMIALLGGEKLSEHENYGEATVHMLHGRVRLGAGENRWDGSPGGLIVVPDGRHDLEPWRTPSCCSRGEAPVTVVAPEVHHEHPARWAQDTALVPLPWQRVDDDPAIGRPVQCGAFDCPWSYVASQRAELIPDPASTRAGESSPRTPAPGRATGVR